MISVHLQGKPLNVTVNKVYAPNTDAKEAEVKWFSLDLQGLLELTAKERCPFPYRRLECKVKSQKIPGVTGKCGLGSTK